MAIVNKMTVPSNTAHGQVEGDAEESIALENRVQPMLPIKDGLDDNSEFKQDGVK